MTLKIPKYGMLGWRGLDENRRRRPKATPGFCNVCCREMDADEACEVVEVRLCLRCHSSSQNIYLTRWGHQGPDCKPVAA